MALQHFSGQVIVEFDGTKYNERNWFTTSDANFFNVLDFEFIAGDKRTALSEPFSVELSTDIVIVSSLPLNVMWTACERVPKF